MKQSIKKELIKTTLLLTIIGCMVGFIYWIQFGQQAFM